MEGTQQRNDEQEALWNGPAGQGWVDAQEVIDELFRPFEELLADAVAAGPGSRVLDIGCGTGSTTRAAARRLGANGHCVGVDISEPMIVAARVRAEREGTPATFIRADAQTHPFAPASFDTIISRFGVMFFDDFVRAFANLRHAARDGAEARFIVWRGPSENQFMTAAERAAAPFLPNLPVRQADAPGQFAFADPDRTRRLLEEGGWSAVDIRPLDVPCSLPAPELRRYVTRIGPVSRVLLDADEATRAQVVDTVLRAFDPYVHGSEVRFSAACWMIGARA
jgi:SAM-dependent methyltransferase